VFYTASLVAGAFGGILAGAVTGNMDGMAGIRGWKWLFLVEGFGTIVVAIIGVFVLPDFPHSTKVSLIVSHLLGIGLARASANFCAFALRARSLFAISVPERGASLYHFLSPLLLFARQL
jgi:hypothetical protein